MAVGLFVCLSLVMASFCACDAGTIPEEAKQKEPEECSDEWISCADFARMGACAGEYWQVEICAKTCGSCTAENEECSDHWPSCADLDSYFKGDKWRAVLCAKTFGLCKEGK